MMKILYNNNIYECQKGTVLTFTIDMGETSVGIPIAKRLWITDTAKDYADYKLQCKWEKDGSENIILAGLNNECDENESHTPYLVELMCGENDVVDIDNELVWSIDDESSSSFQALNVVLTTSIEDIGTTHQRTLIIYRTNSNEIIAKITFIGETISEDMDIASMSSLQGLHISPEDMYVFYEADPYEPVFSSELLNRKRKEYLLCVDRLKDKIGTEAGLKDVIKYFGYDDMCIGTIWKVTNTDSPYYNNYNIKYVDNDGNSNSLDTNELHYKQINRCVLVYKIVKTLDVEFDKLPQTAQVNSYGIDGNSVKLARLREVMNEQFMPAAIPIREILGECDVYYIAKTIHKATDNLMEFDYAEHNIRLTIAKEDIYEYRKSRYYMLAARLFSNSFIDKVQRAENDCKPDSYTGCLLYRIKRVQTIYQLLKNAEASKGDDVVILRGDNIDGCVGLRAYIYNKTSSNQTSTKIICGDDSYTPYYYDASSNEYKPLTSANPIDIAEYGTLVQSNAKRKVYELRVKATGLTNDNIKDVFKLYEGEDYTIHDVPDTTIPYFTYLLVTPKEKGQENFVADTYSCIHSEAIVLMSYIYEATECLADKLHSDAIESPDYQWVIWQELADGIALPKDRDNDDRYNDDENVLNKAFIDRYCGRVVVSLSSQDAFHYAWNDIHSWWDHTSRYSNGEFKDGMTWVNHASINKIEWNITLHNDPNIKYTYINERGDVSKSIPFEGDYDIYGVPVTAAIYVYHAGSYDVEAIIYDNFGHIDRLYRENAFNVHPSHCYLNGIAQNVIDIDNNNEINISKERGEDYVNRFCNAFLYGPMRYNREFDNTNGLLFKLPYFPKIVTTDTQYYLYPFTIKDAVESNKLYDNDESNPFSLPNLIPSQPTALILPLESTSSYETPGINISKIKLWNTGKVWGDGLENGKVPDISIVITKGSDLYKYNLAKLKDESRYDDEQIIEDLESLPFFSNYKWQVTFMPHTYHSKDVDDIYYPILMGVAKSLSKDMDVDDIYFAPTPYTEHMDIKKESSPIEYDLSFVPHLYDAVIKNSYNEEDTLSNMTYASIIEEIKNRKNENGERWYVYSMTRVSTNINTTIPKIQGEVYGAFIGMPNYGSWNYIAGGYMKLKKYSWACLSIDNNNIPAKHNIVWDIEYKSILKDSANPQSIIDVSWNSILSDDSFELLNNVTRDEYNQGKYRKNDFPIAYFPYMFINAGTYRVKCTFKDINGDMYETPYVIIDIE